MFTHDDASKEIVKKGINYRDGTKYYARDKNAKYFHIVLINLYFTFQMKLNSVGHIVLFINFSQVIYILHRCKFIDGYTNKKPHFLKWISF